MYNFEEFYEIGEELAQSDDEAHIRSAINRNYYALFGESRRYLVEVKGKKYIKTKKGIHGKVCNALLASKDPTEEYIGELLLDLMKIRGFADYDWKNKDINYFKKVLPKLKKDVCDGLKSLKYLNRKYKKNNWGELKDEYE